MTQIFSTKLDNLIGTIELLEIFDTDGISSALSMGRGRYAIAIGSGGSAVSAEYFACVRETLGLGPTLVQTPMELVFSSLDLMKTDVWLFSAGSSNSDIMAALCAAADRGAKSIHLVTRSSEGAVVKAALVVNGKIHIVPVLEHKDGYLATHSLVSTVGALLLAGDNLADHPIGSAVLVSRLLDHMSNVVSSKARIKNRATFASLKRTDTLMIVADPQLRSVSNLLETSLWEASICTVQATDFRNFAHGRHSWLHLRGKDTVLLALTGVESQAIWHAMDGRIPDEVRKIAVDFAGCGRLDNALGVIECLAIIEAMGASVGIDPGKPGIAEFGREIYQDDTLRQGAERLRPAISHKRAAMRRDDTQDGLSELTEVENTRRARLAKAEFAGIVLDYDGTIVDTNERYELPRSEIVQELKRLLRDGIAIGIATGRGGSVGTDLRKCIPHCFQHDVLVGYYNGGYLQPLDVDIECYPPEKPPSLSATADWLRSHTDILVCKKFREGRMQITLQITDLKHPEQFLNAMSECEEINQNNVKVIRSGHSFDIVPITSRKQNVTNEIHKKFKGSGEVLCIGDSGSNKGNDFNLLDHPFGISVDQVCGNADGCWSLFGKMTTGPDALLRILCALKPSLSGKFWLDIAALSQINKSEIEN